MGTLRSLTRASLEEGEESSLDPTSLSCCSTFCDAIAVSRRCFFSHQRLLACLVWDSIPSFFLFGFETVCVSLSLLLKSQELGWVSEQCCEMNSDASEIST